MMANNTSSRQAGHAARYVVARVTASILTLMSRPCGMTQKWWCWSWADWKTVRHCWLR